MMQANLQTLLGDPKPSSEHYKYMVIAFLETWGFVGMQHIQGKRKKNSGFEGLLFKRLV
jgi:hypothetical protein